MNIMFWQTCSQYSISPEAASSSKLCFKHLKTWQRGEKYDHDLNLELCFIRRPSYPTDIITKVLQRIMCVFVLHFIAKWFSYINTLERWLRNELQNYPSQTPSRFKQVVEVRNSFKLMRSGPQIKIALGNGTFLFALAIKQLSWLMMHNIFTTDLNIGSRWSEAHLTQTN